MKIISLNVLTVPVLAQTEKYKSIFTITGEKKHNVRTPPTVSTFNWFNNIDAGGCFINFEEEEKELSIEMDTQNPENLVGIALHGHLGMVISNWITEIIQPNCLSTLGKRPCPDLYSMWVEVVFENQKRVLMKMFPISTGSSGFLFKVTDVVGVE